ncbi:MULTISPECIES: hypothetical protein [unclassified Mesorhizobium]|uniref:hypothetical protein n=1 Tax=unclassified Mesorhizobium TaxID=325217 RepID=UPI000FE579FF|nr:MULTISPECIES: hypothetical protein [unclassified Mesorhizobium]RWC21012.1 MAG: hypothetical protein EOS51_12500 [Mesorhizobium sp.]RWD76137.1 MAG: hypothetical protein EOS48_30965 [Mesorhizobium sp.]RWE52107.1 MAG: hypothetical protein EOS67_31180 [Mesorhizobium sp.]RWE92391.1 MAG: hypothetical protein EOS68_25730 [Mesorhizobium sp.]RWF51351.1 MAG: hypothetical protein EOS50_28205 [Mesorhizobium sp.]
MEGRSAEEEAVRVVDKTASLRSARDHQRLPEERSEIQNDWRQATGRGGPWQRTLEIASATSIYGRIAPSTKYDWRTMHLRKGPAREDIESSAHCIKDVGLDDKRDCCSAQGFQWSH